MVSGKKYNYTFVRNISELKSDISQGTLHTKVWGYSTCIKFAPDKVPISTMLFQGHFKYFY